MMKPIHEPVTMRVRCSGKLRRIQVDEGTITFPDHPPTSLELMQLIQSPCRCIEYVRARESRWTRWWNRLPPPSGRRVGGLPGPTFDAFYWVCLGALNAFRAAHKSYNAGDERLFLVLDRNPVRFRFAIGRPPYPILIFRDPSDLTPGTPWRIARHWIRGFDHKVVPAFAGFPVWCCLCRITPRSPAGRHAAGAHHRRRCRRIIDTVLRTLRKDARAEARRKGDPR